MAKSVSVLLQFQVAETPRQKKSLSNHSQELSKIKKLVYWNNVGTIMQEKNFVVTQK